MKRIERKPRAADSLVCAFTGHRPKKLGFTPEQENELRLKLRAELLRLVGRNYTHFMSGGAQGFDLIAAEEVLYLRSQLPFVTLEMVLPWENQTERWNPAEKKRHRDIVARADLVTVIEEEYTKGCLFQRNRFLVDNCDLLLALYRGLPGGTRMTVSYAQSSGKTVQIIE